MEATKTMYERLQVVLALLIIGSIPSRTIGRELAYPSDLSVTAREARQLMKSIDASDHERLAAYYWAQAGRAAKKLAEAQALQKKWAPINRASKVPDPYPHAGRLVAEYSAQVERYSRLAADQQWVAEKARRAADSFSGIVTAQPKAGQQGSYRRGNLGRGVE